MREVPYFLACPNCGSLLREERFHMNSSVDVNKLCCSDCPFVEDVDRFSDEDIVRLSTAWRMSRGRRGSRRVLL